MSFYRATERTARKRYLCASCHKAIFAGERYVNVAGSNVDGDFWAGAYHPDCRDWEIYLNQEAGLGNDEWESLDGFVNNEGPVALQGAPVAVRARFGLAPESVP